MAIELILKDVSLQERSRGAVSGDVAMFRYEISGEGVDRGTIEIVVPWTGDLGAAQIEAHDRVRQFAPEFAKQVLTLSP
jgi:hypothetical protein